MDLQGRSIDEVLAELREHNRSSFLDEDELTDVINDAKSSIKSGDGSHTTTPTFRDIVEYLAENLGQTKHGFFLIRSLDKEGATDPKRLSREEREKLGYRILKFNSFYVSVLRRLTDLETEPQYSDLYSPHSGGNQEDIFLEQVGYKSSREG